MAGGGEGSRAIRRALAVGALLTFVAVALTIALPLALGVPPAQRQWYDGLIGAVAAALIGGAVAASITIYVLDKSLANQDRLHKETLDLLRKQHLQVLRQQARGVRVEATYDEGARLASAARRLHAHAAAGSAVPQADKEAFAATALAFNERAHHIEMEALIGHVERSLVADQTRELRTATAALYESACKYLRAESVSGVDWDIPYEPSPGRLR